MEQPELNNVEFDLLTHIKYLTTKSIITESDIEKVYANAHKVQRKITALEEDCLYWKTKYEEIVKDGK